LGLVPGLCQVSRAFPALEHWHQAWHQVFPCLNFKEDKKKVEKNAIRGFTELRKARKKKFANSNVFRENGSRG
jgi:hypothetical protein